MELKEINQKLETITNTKQTVPLSKRGKEIYYTFDESANILEIEWGDTEFKLADYQINDILDIFFTSDKWYPLGSSMTDPIEGGLGEYVDNTFNSFTPRHASAIAAVLVNENFLTYKGAKPIKLKKDYK